MFPRAFKYLLPPAEHCQKYYRQRRLDRFLFVRRVCSHCFLQRPTESQSYCRGICGVFTLDTLGTPCIVQCARSVPETSCMHTASPYACTRCAALPPALRVAKTLFRYVLPETQPWDQSYGFSLIDARCFDDNTTTRMWRIVDPRIAWYM